MRWILLLGLCAVQGWAQLPVQVKANIAAARPVRTMSIVVYSTYRLNPEDPGLIVE
jgi:hypothetical protein